jgi:YHS domain-containing protein
MPDESIKPLASVVPLSFQSVCRRVIVNNPVYYPQAEYQGRVIYFCTSFCLDAFNADPDRFYIAHSRLKNTQNKED